MGETDTKVQNIKTSELQDGNTSNEESATFTKETVEAMVSKARSDALAELGRYKKAADEAVKQMHTIEERISRLQEERFENELETAKDDPDRLREIRQRQRETKDRLSAETEKRRWESDKAAYDERIKRAEAIERRDLAREVANEFQVDYKALEKFGTDRESMIELAKSLPKSGDAQGGQDSRGNRATNPPEGGKTGRTGGTLTKEQAAKMGPDEVNANQKALAEMSF